MTTATKVKQVNYSADVITNIVSDYQSAMTKAVDSGLSIVDANKQVLTDLSVKHGKTVPSLRAKLASLKAYKSANNADNNAPISGNKATKKEDLALTISNIVGVELVGLEVATKATLQTLLTFLLNVSKLIQEKDEKINSLVAEMLETDENA